MEDDNMNNAIFYALKPVCDQLVVDANQEKIRNLSSLLSRLPPKSIQKFQSYICFPIEIQLHKTTNTELKQMLVDVLTKLLSLSYIDSVSDLLRLSSLLFQQVAASDQISVADVSEELKMSVVVCLSQLWCSAMTDVLYNVYTRENYPRLSPLIFMLVRLAKNEKLIKLRVAALECLLLLCHVHDSVDLADREMHHRVQSVVMLMLPGIVSCCVNIAAEPSTQNHKITVANIKLWSRVVCLVMDDREPPQTQDRPSIPLPTTTVERVQQMQQQLRTADWLQDTADKLTPVTEALLRTQTHTHWQVRQQLAQATHSLLICCARNLSPSVGSLVCCMIVLSEDEIEAVKAPARQALAEVSSVFEHDTGQSLLQLVESAFYSLLSRSPRIMQGTDENSQLTCLRLLVGYLRLQGTKLPLVLSSSSFLHRLLVTLVHISRLDTSQITLLEECSIREVESERDMTEPWKQLMYCDSVQKLQRLQDVFSVLREFADLHMITHALIDLLDSNPEYTKEIVLLINNILAGGGPNSMQNQGELLKTAIGVYIQPRLWRVPFSVTQPENPASTLSEAQSNIVQVSLLAEGLGLFALAMGGKHFSLCLLRCLYPLLECAGSPLHPLSSAGLAAVQNVAQACVGGGVTELVRANVDYLSHHITLRLRRAHQNPGVLSVLSVVMRHTTVDVLPSLHEIIEDVLVQSCDEFQEYNANGFLRVFLTFLVCLRGWQQEKPEIPPSPSSPHKQKKSILEELLEYKRCIEAAENFKDDDEPVEVEITEEMFRAAGTINKEECMEEEAEEAESKPKEVPPSIKITVELLERSLHFLPSKDEQRQILVLDILREGVLVLKSEEDQLLPIVHKIWSPLLNRFQSSVTKPLIMHRAFLLLCVLGNTARDFIRNRTLKQVLPALCKTLQDSAKQSHLKDSGSAYRLTQQYKLQRAILAGLGHLAVDLAMQERDLHNILVAVTPYLSIRQPAPLQELCQQLYKDIASVQPNLVWCQLMSVWSPVSQFVPPTPDIPLIELDTCCDEGSEYKKNVNELLQFLDS